ncbi:transglutaminase-like domain-containing protein [uncultured Methanobrevibacter sp.]|mgnify:CR=1 FL=1|uniref:transglutaminase-like domain-containing protein n=1 Tax=uncultured Methanobrevibacter sp. TaxID=253161 RepID=UPI00261A866B|nr:transglutaminase-like domain-containing protein [uncultured Methanobrevibacter sp.]
MNFKYTFILFILVLVSSVSFVSATDSSISEIDNINFESNQNLYENLEVSNTNEIETSADLKNVDSSFIEDTSNPPEKEEYNIHIKNITIGNETNDTNIFKTVIKGDDISITNSNLPITIKTHTTTVYQTQQLNLYLLTSNGGRVILNNQPITITLNGVSYTRYFDENGIASININLVARSTPYSVNCYFSGYGNFLSSSSSFNMKVIQKSVNLYYLTNVVNKGVSGEGFRAKLIDQFNVPVMNKAVKIKINGVTYSRDSNNYGIANLNINLNPGTYSVDYWYDNEEKGYSSLAKQTVSLTVKSDGNSLIKTTISRLNYTLQESSKIAVKLSDANGNPISNKNINIWLGINKIISSTTNSKGIAYFDMFSTNFGDATFTFVFEGDSVYRSTGVVNTYVCIEKTTSNKYSSSDSNGGSNIPLSYYKTSYNTYDNYTSSYIQKLASTLTASCSDDLEKTIAIHHYVYVINYENYGNHKYGGKESLLRYAGNCLDKTSAFVTLLRAVNIPVRYVLGDNYPSSTVGHAWAQVCFDNTWVVSEVTNTLSFGDWQHGATYSNKQYGVIVS